MHEGKRIVEDNAPYSTHIPSFKIIKYNHKYKNNIKYD